VGCVLPSSPSPCTWLSHAPSTTLDKTPLWRAAGFPFHGHAPPTCSAFQSAASGSGIALSPGFPLRAVYHTTAFPQPGASRASQVLQRISSCMPQPEDSGRLPHARLAACFLLASGYVKTLAFCHKLVSKLYQLSGHAVAPTACRILCVRFTCLVRLLLLPPPQAQHSIRVGG
jgi:hypothetical protein